MASACNRLVTDISARSTAVARDTGWPYADVSVWFGSHLVPLPMRVLAHSSATRMRDTELGARLSAYARRGIDESYLAEIVVRVALPSQPEAQSAPGSVLPSPRGFGGAEEAESSLASDAEHSFINENGSFTQQPTPARVERDPSPALEHLPLELAFDPEAMPSKKIRTGTFEFGGGAAAAARRASSTVDGRRLSLRAEAIGAARSRRSSAVGLPP